MKSLVNLDKKRVDTLHDVLEIDLGLKVLSQQALDGLKIYAINSIRDQFRKNIRRYEKSKAQIVENNLPKGKVKIDFGTPEWKKVNDELTKISDNEMIEYRYCEFPVSMLEELKFREDEGDKLAPIMFIFTEDEPKKKNKGKKS